jgi:hypothetical protein
MASNGVAPSFALNSPIMITASDETSPDPQVEAATLIDSRISSAKLKIPCPHSSSKPIPDHCAPQPPNPKAQTSPAPKYTVPLTPFPYCPLSPQRGRLDSSLASSRVRISFTWNNLRLHTPVERPERCPSVQPLLGKLPTANLSYGGSCAAEVRLLRRSTFSYSPILSICVCNIHIEAWGLGCTLGH